MPSRGCTSQPGLDAFGSLTTNVATSHDGASVYVITSKSTLAQFAVQADGSLAYVTCIGDATLAGTNPCPVAAPGIKEGNGGGGSVAVSPDDASVYVTGFDSDTVAVFRRDTSGPTRGHLTSDGCISDSAVTTCDAVPGTTHGKVAGLDGPERVEVSADGTNAYVTAAVSKTVVAFKRDTGDAARGKLTGDGCLANTGVNTCNAVPGSTHGQATSLNVPVGMAFSPDGSALYVVDALKAVTVLARDTAGATPGRLTGDGCLANTGTTTCDAVAGSTHGQAPGINNPQLAVLSSDGANLYVAGQGFLAALKRDGSGPTPNRLTSDGCLAQTMSATCDAVPGNTHGRSLGASAKGIAISADGKDVYTTDFAGSLVAVFSRDAAGGLTFDGCRANTGTATCDTVAGSTQGQAPGLFRPSSVVVAPNDAAVYAASDNPGSVVAFSRFVPPPATPPAGAPTGGGPPPEQPSLPPAFAGLTLKRGSLTIDSKGRGKVSLSCPAAAQGACAGSGVFNSATKIVLRDARAKKKIQKLATFKFKNVAPGRTAKVPFKLSRKALRLLRRKRTLKSVLTVTAHDSRGVNVKSTARETLKIRKTKKN